VVTKIKIIGLLGLVERVIRAGRVVVRVTIFSHSHTTLSHIHTCTLSNSYTLALSHTHTHLNAREMPLGPLHRPFFIYLILFLYQLYLIKIVGIGGEGQECQYN
jgi:hypothetical protein